MEEQTQPQDGSESTGHPHRPEGAIPSRELHHVYEFGAFRLDPAERKFERDNKIIPLTPKVFDTLTLLVRNAGRLLEKDELLRTLWSDSFVEEGSLTNNIFILRKTLGKDVGFIETVPRRGYRFIGPVRVLPATETAPSRNLPEDKPQLLQEPAPVCCHKPHSMRGRVALVVGVVLVAVLVSAAWFFLSSHSSNAIESVAVLPFVNSSGDTDTEYLADGITENLIDRLTQLPGLRVMARSTVFRLKGKDTDPVQVGRDLHVRAVLTGRMLQRGDKSIVRAELIDVSRESQIWGAEYDRPLADFLALQEVIAQEISESLRPHLTGEDRKRLAKNYTVNSDAYQDYLKGRFWWNKGTEEGFNKGIEYFQRAIVKDPNYAQAYSGIADCYSSLASEGLISATEGYLKAKDAALKALQLDGTLTEAHTSLGLVKTSYDWDWSGADKEFQRAIELNPSYEEAHRFRAAALWQAGRLDEAIAETKRTLELDPISLGSNVDLGYEFFLNRQFDQAIEQEQKVLELDPDNVEAYYFWGMAYTKKSMFKEAMTEFEKAAAIAPDNLIATTGLGYGYAVTGRKASALKLLDQLKALSQHKYVSPVWMAKIYAGLEDKDEAFKWLERAYEDHSVVSVGYIKTNPMFDPLRSDPRYNDLLRRTNLCMTNC